MAITILPGEIADALWTGPRCITCGRKIGGDGSEWATCDDVGQAHFSMASIPNHIKLRFARDGIWNNAVQVLQLLGAIRWMTKKPRGGLAPITVLEAEDGDAAVELYRAQFDEWPALAKQREAMAKLSGR